MDSSSFRKTMALATAAALILSAVLLLLFSDPYRFRAEPVRSKQELSLKKTALKDRKPIRPTLCRDRLSDNLALIYDEIGGQLENSVGGSFWLSNASKADFACAWKAYSDDHPEVFWISSETPYSYYEMDGELEIEFNYVLSGEELEGAKKELNKAAEKAFAYAPDNPDDLELEVFINDYLVNHCEYKTGAELCHTSYGALVNGEAVCDGYSRAFQLLCRNAGISCAVIEGTSDFNDDKNVGHMWNLVQLDGDWYHADVTWNDIDKAKFFCERYFFLNVDDKEIRQDHRINPVYSPEKHQSGEPFNIFIPKCETERLRYLDICFATVSDLQKDDDMIAALIAAARNKDKSCNLVIAKTLPYKETCNKLIHENYLNDWINAANRYCDGTHQIGTDTKAYTYKNKNVLTIELKYD